jgi:hypothetical protein
LPALFVADWNAEEPKVPFEDRAVMTVQSSRPLHNFPPETCASMAHRIFEALEDVDSGRQDDQLQRFDCRNRAVARV